LFEISILIPIIITKCSRISRWCSW